ncbi:hypothetical protein ABZ461_30590 [Actinacidiphila glaucinigra]|uniref:hypothetical protein n=1 Tax=Actinacidiphila glaucinigra TaxID=235986 RepID=UPI0033FEDAB2
MTDADTYDAVVVGGHNGLVAALYLARAGWSVAVLERNAAVFEQVPRPGPAPATTPHRVCLRRAGC